MTIFIFLNKKIEKTMVIKDSLCYLYTIHNQYFFGGRGFPPFCMNLVSGVVAIHAVAKVTYKCVYTMNTPSQ